MARPAVGCVVLTQGGRPDDLRRALESLLRQRDVELDVVVVGNGWAPTGLPAGVRGVERPTDEDIPAGRNFGVPHVHGELLFFLDDDASLADHDALARVAALFAADADLGMAQLRVAPATPGPAAREWVPRLRVGGLAALRRAAGRLPFYRAFVAVEATLLALAAAVFDALAGELAGTRALVVALVPVAAVTAVGHLLAILTSSRLR